MDHLKDFWPVLVTAVGLFIQIGVAWATLSRLNVTVTVLEERLEKHETRLALLERLQDTQKPVGAEIERRLRNTEGELGVLRERLAGHTALLERLESKLDRLLER